MVNLKKFPGISAQVFVDGKPLKKYIDDTIEEEEGTVTRYVEAVSDKDFEVHFHVEKGTKITRTAVSFRVEVDGEWVRTKLSKSVNFTKKDHYLKVDGHRVGTDQIQKLSFATLETASDGRMFHVEASRVKVLGTICVTISFLDFGNTTKPRLSQARHDPGFISEKALKGKAITHGVNFRAPVAQAHLSEHISWDTSNVDHHNKFQIIFKYRSIEALKQMYLVPRTPSPPPIERRDPGSLSREEIAEMQKQLLSEKAKNDATVKIKRERKDDNPRPRKVARPSAGATLLEIDDENGVRELSTATLGSDEKEVIELD